MLHNNQLISIEEILVKSSSKQSNNQQQQKQKQRQQTTKSLRKFLLFNRNSNLKISIYTLGAKVISCMLNEQQIIVNNNNVEDVNNCIDRNNNNDYCDDLDKQQQNDDDNQIITTTIPDNQINQNDNDKDYCWDSHVYGSDTILLINTLIKNQKYEQQMDYIKQTLTYCLTKNNEFIIEGNCNDNDDDNGDDNKQNSNLMMNPFFFNLNYIKDNNPCLDEHSLYIHTSNKYIDIISEQINNDNQDDDLLMKKNLLKNFLNNPTIITKYYNDNTNLYDLIFSTKPTTTKTSESSLLIAKLKYKNRSIEIQLNIDEQIQTNLRIIIKNGSIAFIPYKMNKFRITYRFHW